MPDWPAASVVEAKTAETPVGTPSVDRETRPEKLLLPATVTATVPWPVTGRSNEVGKAATVKSGTVTVKTGPVAGGDTSVVTVTGPLVAPCGTVVTSAVPAVFTELTMAGCPLKAIWLLAAVGLKLLPAIVTTVPAGPLSGLLPMIEGDPSITVTALVALVPFSEAVISA